MQPNTYGQPAPQGYPQQYQPAPPANFIPPQYPAQPAGYQQQPQPQSQPASDGQPFSDPSRGGGGLAPRMRHLVGRTVIFQGLRVDENAKNPGNPNEVRPTAYAHMIVVDGGEIIFGEDKLKGTPPTHRIVAPARFANVAIGNTWVVNAIRDDLPPLGRGLLLGVVVQGQQGNRPFLLTKIGADENGNERADGEQRRAAALNLWRAFESGQWQSPVPELLPGVAPAPVNYAYAQQQPAQYAQQQVQAPAQPAFGYYGPTPTQAGYAPQQQPAQQQYPGGPVEQYNNPSAPYVEQHPGQHAQAQTMNAAAIATAQQPIQPQSAPPMQQPPAPGMLGVPGAAFDVNSPPPDWDASTWGNFNPEQRAAVWARVQQSQPAPSGPQANQHPGF